MHGSIAKTHLSLITEREVAVRLFSSLGSRPGSRRQRSLSEPGVKFRPPSRQPLPPPVAELRQSSYNPRYEYHACHLVLTYSSLASLVYYIRTGHYLLTSVEGQKLRTRRLSAPPKDKPKPWPAGIWHHRPVRDPPPNIYRGASVFGQVRGPASHYSIHPEWPDYYNNSDVVH